MAEYVFTGGFFPQFPEMNNQNCQKHKPENFRSTRNETAFEYREYSSCV